METLMRAITIAFTLALLPAHASSEEKSQATQSTETREKREEAQPKRESEGDSKIADTDSCRRDARGLQGPERARFMTDCIKKR